MKVFKKSILTTTIMGAVMLLLLTSCGKDNKSGGGNSSIYSQNGIGIPGGVNGSYLSTVMNEYPCASGLQRIGVQIPLNMSVAVGGAYVGVTSEGDVATVSSNNGQGIMTAYVCQRQGLTSGNGNLAGNPVINRSVNCALDEISAATMYIQSYYGTLTMNFRPIYMGHGSSLCR